MSNRVGQSILSWGRLYEEQDNRISDENNQKKIPLFSKELKKRGREERGSILGEIFLKNAGEISLHCS